MARERNVRSKRKRCKVFGRVEDKHGISSFYRCEAKIKPGTPFCKEHFETHKLIEVKCTGEAHSNPYIDHYGVCMPHWGSYPSAVPKDWKGAEPDWTRSW